MSLNEIVSEAFTELAPSYKETMDTELIQFWGISYLAFVEKMLALAAVKPGEKILDIATGTAVIPLTIRSNSDNQDQIVGLDITPAMLAEGRKDIKRDGHKHGIDLVCASAMKMPFADGLFEIVLCGLGTHHMEVPQMLQEAKRVLKDGGRLVICDVGATSFWRSLIGKTMLWVLLKQYGFTQKGSRAQAEIEAFKNVRTAQEWSNLLRDFGFSKIHIDEVKPRFPWFPSGLTLTAEVRT